MVQLRKSTNPAEGKGRNTKRGPMPKAKTTPPNERKEKVPTQIPIPSLDRKPLTNRVKQITQREGKLHCSTMALGDLEDAITLQNSRLVAYHFWTSGENVQVVLIVM